MRPRVSGEVDNPDAPAVRRHRWRTSAVAALGVVTLLAAVDALSGLAYNTSSSAQVAVSRPQAGAVDEALIVFPGYASSGLVISKAFTPYLTPGQALVVVSYAQRGIDDQTIYEQVMAQVKGLGPRRLRVLGGSLGGLVAARFIMRYATSPDRQRFGDPVLVLDTVPTGAETIRRPRWAFALSAWYRGGILSSAGWVLISRWGERPNSEPGADRSIIADGEQANAWIGTPALTTQAAYLDAFDPKNLLALRGVVQRATYLTGNSSHEDPLVLTQRSIEGWRAALPGLRVVTIPTRQGDWHIPWTYRPSETLQAVSAA